MKPVRTPVALVARALSCFPRALSCFPQTLSQTLTQFSPNQPLWLAPQLKPVRTPVAILGSLWGLYLCAGKPPLDDIILSHPPDLTRCDSVIGLAIRAMSGHIQYRGAAN